MLYLLIIFLLAVFLRFYGLNWDQGFHLHPDERAIVMFTTPLQFPKSIAEFISPQSEWNPHFFAYGSFPIYFLKIAGNVASIVDPTYATYDKINLLGRFISAIFDIGTLCILFFLAKKLFNKHVGLLAAFFYAISVLPIQLSHFYAVDTPLTFFILVTLYQLVRLYEKPTVIKSILVGFFFGISLATKTSALVLVASIGMAIAVDFLLIFLKNPHRPHIWFPHVPKFLKRLFTDGFVIAVVTIITFIIFEPYALIDFKEFLKQTQETSQVMYNAFAFPFTLQYVGKIPYWYELKNIFLWGQGPLLASFSFLGVLFVTFKALTMLYSSSEVEKSTMKQLDNRTIIILTFFWIYFLVVGHFAIGFMRYMLPLYPLFCLFAAVFLHRLLSFRAKSRNLRSLHALRLVGMTAGIALLLIWPLMFLHIYTKPNTRVQATNWINQNIPLGSVIATEHWDDGLPLETQSNYKILELPMYEPDTTAKWEKINMVLQQTEYIILASNRLYVPLMKLTNCAILPMGRCYTQTAAYYKNLFAGSLNFKKVAEFFVLPQLSTFNFQLSIDDSSADESFTVYDHPKVMIFKRVN